MSGPFSGVGVGWPPLEYPKPQYPIVSPYYFGSANFGSGWPGAVVERYMGKYWFEGRDYVPNHEFYYPDVPERRYPNTHQLVKRFLKQVRQSKGYDVDCTPPKMFNSPFKPVDWESAKTYDSGHYYLYNLLGSAKFAVGRINELTGRNYELVEIVKAVDTTCLMWMYLTLTARDRVAHGANAPVETFQALVEVPRGRYNTITNLLEWRRI